MREMTFVGDVHGKYGPYKKIIKRTSPSIALGDMGVGFRHYSGPNDGEPAANPPYNTMVANDARFIRGNHDNPLVCRNHNQCIKDGTIEDGVMFIGGAYSIDRAYRHESYDWWEDEQLSHSELNEILDKAIEEKPFMMVTHDCPMNVAPEIFTNRMVHKDFYASRTNQMFQSLFEIVKPRCWAFGHWHISTSKIIDKTKFICLGELDTLTLDLDSI